jgi:hypothetical protein
MVDNVDQARKLDYCLLQRRLQEEPCSANTQVSEVEGEIKARVFNLLRNSSGKCATSRD